MKCKQELLLKDLLYQGLFQLSIPTGTIKKLLEYHLAMESYFRRKEMEKLMKDILDLYPEEKFNLKIKSTPYSK